jgi:protein CpxP
MSKWMNATRLFVAVLIIGFCGSLVMAAAEPNEPNKPRQRMRGQGRNPQVMVEQRLKEMTTQLNLNQNQQKSIKLILQAEVKQMQALMGDPNLPREQRRAKMQENRAKMEEIRKNTDQKIERLLTADQKEKYKKMLEEQTKQRQQRQAQRQGRQGQGPGQGQGAAQGQQSSPNAGGSAGDQGGSDSGQQ